MTETPLPPPLSHDDLIVIADDEAFSRLMLAELLDRLGAPRVITARNGREALTVLDDPKAAGVRVVILDFNMPEANGIEVLQEIRSGRRAVPHDVIVMMITSVTSLGPKGPSFWPRGHFIPVSDRFCGSIRRPTPDVLRFNNSVPVSNVCRDEKIVTAPNPAVNHRVCSAKTWINGLGLMAAAVALDVDVFLSKPIGLAALRDGLVNVLESARDCAAPDFYTGIDIAWLTALKQIDTSSQQGEYVSLYALSEGMILANNLFDEQGDLLVAAGSRVTPRLLRLLNGLAACGLPLDRLRVTRSA